MKFKKFLEGCEAINEAEYNKEWWDSKSDSFKQRYIERHPNSIYAQKAKSAPAGMEKRANKPVSFGKSAKTAINTLKKNQKNTSVKGVNALLKDKSAAEKDFETASTVLLDHPTKDDAWYRKVIALAEHPYTPKSIIKRMEKEHPYVALHSPKASQEFLDAQAKNLDPFKDYTWIDVLVQNPSLDTSQRETIAKKLKKAINDADSHDYGDQGDADYFKKRFQWQLDTLSNK